MLAAACAVLALAAPPAGPAAAGAAGPGSPPSIPAARPGHGDGSNPGQQARADARGAAERELLESLVPPPLDDARVRALAADLGAGPGAGAAVDALLAEYRTRTTDAHAKAAAAVRTRLGTGYRPTTAAGALEPVAGPELTALLEESAAWRAALAAADADLLQRAALMRSGNAVRCPGLAAFRRAIERDDLPADDPGAALRVTDLLDVARVDAAERRRAEDALDRQWSAMADAIARRRQEVAAVALERARLEESWGARWQLTATAGTAEERLQALDRLADRERSSEAPLRTANRTAADALLRVLAPDAADRVRDAVDRALWPWLFAGEAATQAAVDQATAAGGPAYGEPLAAMAHEMRNRLAATRRELSKAAMAADALDRPAPGSPAVAPAEVLDAQRRLQEAVNRRNRVLLDAARRMQQACAGEPRLAAIMDDRVAAAESASRAGLWQLRSIDARIAELRAPADDAQPPR